MKRNPERFPVCLRPWYALSLLRDEVVVCGHARYPIGNLSEGRTLEEWWNHPRWVTLRERFLAGEEREYCGDDCQWRYDRSETFPRLLRHPEWLAARLQARGCLPGRTWLSERVRREQDNLAEIVRAVRRGETRLAPRPASLYLQCSNACNLRCKICFEGKAREYRLHPGGWRVIREAIPTARFASLLGGEPFHAPEILALLDEWRGLGRDQPAVSIVTNGVNATPERVRGLRLASLVFSIDGARPETYRAIRGADCWHQVIDNLRAVKRACRRWWWPRPALLVAMTVMTRNFREVPEMIALTRRLGVGLQLIPVNYRWAGEEDVFAQSEQRAELARVIDASRRLTRSSLTRGGLRMMQLAMEGKR